MRPSVTRATAQAAVLEDGEDRGQAVELGHAVGLRALEADDDDGVAGELAGLEGVLDRLLVVEDPGRGLDDVALRGDGGDLHHAGAEVAGEAADAAGRLEGVGGRAEDLVVERGAGAVGPDEVAVDQLRLLGVAGEAVAGDGAGVVVEEAGVEELADHVAEAAGGVEVVHVGEAVGVDPRHQGRRVGEVGEVLPVEEDAGGAGHGDQVDEEVGRAAGGVEADDAVDEGALVEDVADRGVLVAEGGDGEGAAGALDGERVAERGVGVDEGRARAGGGP